MPNRTTSASSSRNPMLPNHRAYLLTRAAQIVSNRNNCRMSFQNLTEMLNRRFGTSYSVRQVAATLTNAGYRSSF